MPDVGEDATLTLTVTPHDGTTAASVAVVSPSSVSSTLSPVTADGGGTWNAYLPLTEAGAWQITWTVTGQGSGVEHDTVYAFVPLAGDSYATLSDLAAFLGEVPPDEAGKLLQRATRRVDHTLIGAWYPVDDDGNPTVQKHIDALRDAVCEQVAWWIETGDLTGLGAQGEWQTMSIGRLNLSRGNSRSAAPTGAGTQALCPAAFEVLHLAGMIPFGPYLVG